MTAHISIGCDASVPAPDRPGFSTGCPETARVPGAVSVLEVREVAAQAGWTRKRLRSFTTLLDLCPAHETWPEA